MPRTAIDAPYVLPSCYRDGRSYALNESRPSLPDVCPYADPDMAEAWWKGINDAIAEELDDRRDWSARQR